MGVNGQGKGDNGAPESSKALGFHPIADMFPLLTGEEYENLKADIAANGLREPIWLHPDGHILDGRNRYRACRDLGLEPPTRLWNGKGSAVAFVVSLNLHRRHLNTSQRATIALDVLPMLEEEAKTRRRATQNNYSAPDLEIIPDQAGNAREHAAALFQTNGRYVQDAKKIADAAPDLLHDVRAGTLSIPYAMRKLGERMTRARVSKLSPGAPANATIPRLIVGKATALELADESVDVIITSPPYNLSHEKWPMGGHGRTHRPNGIGYDDNMSDEAYQAWQLEVMDELYRVARPGASLFYNHKPRTRDGALIHPLAWLLKARGWILRQEIIWDRGATHNHSATLFWPIDERVFWLTKGKPSLSKAPIGMPTVWRIHGPAPFTWHPAPFPEEIPRRCLQAVGRPGITVLDPFAGSCTTLRVAVAMGYQAIGVDHEASYLDRARALYGW